MAVQTKAANGSDLESEADLFKAANELRGDWETSGYKHVALGLIFLNHVLGAFEAHYEKLKA